LGGTRRDGGQNVLAKLPGDCDPTSRLLLAARLYDARPERVAGTNGRPRKRGQRLPSPADMLEADAVACMLPGRIRVVLGGGAHALRAGIE